MLIADARLVHITKMGNILMSVNVGKDKMAGTFWVIVRVLDFIFCWYKYKVSMNHFVTGSNGGASFKVKVANVDNSVDNEKMISVFHRSADPSQYIPPFTIEFETKPFLAFITADFFVGKSEKNDLTEHDNSFGCKYDGRSLLCRFGNDFEYLFIETNITVFSTQSKIVSFFSPVGLSGVIHAWAVDQSKNIYLLPYGPILSGDVISQREPIDAKMNPWVLRHDKKVETNELKLLAEISGDKEQLHGFRADKDRVDID